MAFEAVVLLSDSTVGCHVSRRDTVALAAQVVARLRQQAVVRGTVRRVAGHATVALNSERTARIVFVQIRTAEFRVAACAVGFRAVTNIGVARGSREVVAADARHVAVSQRVIGSTLEIVDGSDMALAAEFRSVVDQQVNRSTVDIVAVAAHQVLPNMRIDPDIGHSGVRDVALRTDFFLCAGQRFARINDVLRIRVLDVHFTAGVAAYTRDVRPRILRFRTQPMGRRCQMLIVPVVTHKAGLVIDCLGGTRRRQHQQNQQGSTD